MENKFKKTILLALIVSLAYCLITSNVWNVKDGLPVQFDINSFGKYKIGAVLNKKDDSSFKKIRDCYSHNYLNGSHKIILKPKIRHAKRLKLVFIPEDNKELSAIKISNIMLQDGKVKLDILNKFSAKNAKIEIKNNTIILTPANTKKTVELVYNGSFDLRGHCHVDILLLFTMFFMCFLITYKLFDFMVNRKVFNTLSKIDPIFVAIFFILLFIPASKLDKAPYSSKELRNLNKFPALFLKGYEINPDFAKDFNAAFDDRFYTRKFLVKCFSNLRYKLHWGYSEINLGYVYKKSGWMFLNGDKKIINDMVTPFEEKLLEKITLNIKTLLSYCKNNNIKVYIAIVPAKELIYREYDIYHGNFEHENTFKLVEKVKKELGYDIIYPVDNFRKIRNEELVYFKTDHHLTDFGAYEFYKVIMNRVNKDFNDVKITPLSEFNLSYNNLVRADGERTFSEGGNILRACIRDKKLLEYKYPYYDYKKLDKLEITEEFPYGLHINPKGKYKVFIVGNSMMENLVYFLDTNFQKITKYRFNSDKKIPPRQTRLDMNGYIPLIEKEKPDILFIILSTGNVFELEGLYPDTFE